MISTIEPGGRLDLFEAGDQTALVCLDVQPSGSTQVAERRDVLNIGGFSDTVF